MEKRPNRIFIFSNTSTRVLIHLVNYELTSWHKNYIVMQLENNGSTHAKGKSRSRYSNAWLRFTFPVCLLICIFCSEFLVISLPFFSMFAYVFTSFAFFRLFVYIFGLFICFRSVCLCKYPGMLPKHLKSSNFWPTLITVNVSFFTTFLQICRGIPIRLWSRVKYIQYPHA